VVATDSEAIAVCVEKSRRPRRDDAGRSCLRLRPHLRGARRRRSGRPAAAIVVNVQGRPCRRLAPADIGAGHRAARRQRSRYRETAPPLKSGARGRAQQSERRQGSSATPVTPIIREDGRRAPDATIARRSTSRALRRPAGDGPPPTTISGLYAFRRPGHWCASSACRPRRSNRREQLEQLRARSKPACASMVTIVDSVAASASNNAGRPRGGARAPAEFGRLTSGCQCEYRNRHDQKDRVSGPSRAPIRNLAIREVYPDCEAGAGRATLRGCLRRADGRGRRGRISA